MARKNKEPPDPSGARNSALRALGRREHSAAQLKSKLQFRGFDEGTVEQTVQGLTEKGWQSDARFAELLVRSRIAQGYGALRIELELAQAGVSDAECAAALQAAACDWQEQAGQVHARKFGALPANAAEWQKQYRFLASRGFSGEQVQTVLRGKWEPENS